MNKNVYFIVGCSSQIGCELLKQLNNEKENSLFLAHYNTNLSGIKNIIEKNCNKIIPIQADLSSEKDIIKVIEEINTQYEVPTHIVHLPASKFEYQKLKDFEWSTFENDLNIQVHSIINFLKAFLPIMAKRKNHNKIVIILSSNTISSPSKYTLGYNMTKYMLLGLIKSLATDYSDKSVNINGISPSMVETNFLSQLDSRIVEMNAANSVEKRNASIMDIVPVIKFLLSEDSNYINGINMNVSNGNVM